MGAPFINKSRLLLWGGIALVGALGIAAPKLFQEPAWTKEDAHALMTYATAIGRAEGCGLAVGPEKKTLERWVSRHFQPFPEQFQSVVDQQIAETAMRQKVQPFEPCDTVRESFPTIDWARTQRPWWRGGSDAR